MRYSDGSYDAPSWTRRVVPAYWPGLWPHDADDNTNGEVRLRDIELGFRVGQALDMLEDEKEIGFPR